MATFAGWSSHGIDTLRAENDWQIARREIILDQSILLAKNLTIFF
jgi:3-phenylpropionate/cinnamic acid dioxygenase small subunit